MKRQMLPSVALAAALVFVSTVAVRADALTPSSNQTIAMPTLTIKGFAFGSLTVKRDSRFLVKNLDSADHTLKIVGTRVDVLVKAGGVSTVTAPSAAGTYRLTCDFHSSMHGLLRVTR